MAYRFIFLFAWFCIFCASSFAQDRMKDKVVLITGGSQGIGKGIAEVFAEEGANVIILSRTKDKLASVTKEIEARGGKISYFVADITKEDNMQHVVEKIIEKHKSLDILINNAAGI